MGYEFDPEKAASLIRGALAIQRKTQSSVAEQLGIGLVLFNMYLNRKLNLLPEQVETVLDILNIRKQAEKFCGLNNEK